MLLGNRLTRWLRGSVAVAAVLASGLAAGPLFGLTPPDSTSSLSSKAFFKPELYISVSQTPLDQVLDELPNQAAWRELQAVRPGGFYAFIDPRSGVATNLLSSFPLIPGRGVGNRVTLGDLGARLGRSVAEVDRRTVADAVLEFVQAHRAVLGVDLAQLGAARAQEVTPELWQVSIPQVFQGIPVRYSRLAASINNGNLVLVGTETWGNVRGISPVPKLSADDALAAGFAYAGGGSALDRIVRAPRLEIFPLAVEGQGLGNGYRHVLTWTFAFVRPPELETWEVVVDAHSGEILAFQDINDYAAAQITGGVYPLTDTEICPDAQTCGILQTGWPMPFADTGQTPPNDFTNSGGFFDFTSGTVTTTLTGRFVDVADQCGSLVNSSTSGNLDLGGINGDHDCVSGGGSSGNTAASRTAFYELNKIKEQARGWLPGNTWLNSRLTANVNINNTCNAFYGGTSVNFYRSGGGCRNTGEIAGVFDHEWGHGLDDNDTNGTLSNPSEAYADVAAIYRLHTSCVGHGFFATNDRGCGQTSDGTGFNANEKQNGGTHCDLDCSGVRDADWDRHFDHAPDTALNFVCPDCNVSSGPCGREVHCAAAPVRQAAWDLVARDLPAAPFGLDRESAFVVGNKLFYQGSGNVGTWYACSCGSSSSGCGSTNGYMQWLAADDDNGNLADGTPHMTALFAAFDRHGIACATPTPVDSGCSGGPTTAPTVSVTAGENQASLSWTSVTGASRYWVFRTEGHAGCDFGKALIADVTGTSFTDTEVGGGRTYSYNVVAVGTSSACFTPVSTCQSVTPTAPPPPPPPVCSPSGTSCTDNAECCSGNCRGKPGSKTCK